VHGNTLRAAASATGTRPGRTTTVISARLTPDQARLDFFRADVRADNQADLDLGSIRPPWSKDT